MLFATWDSPSHTRSEGGADPAVVPGTKTVVAFKAAVIVRRYVRESHFCGLTRQAYVHGFKGGRVTLSNFFGGGVMFSILHMGSCSPNFVPQTKWWGMLHPQCLCTASSCQISDCDEDIDGHVLNLNGQFLRKFPQNKTNLFVNSRVICSCCGQSTETSIESPSFKRWFCELCT